MRNRWSLGLAGLVWMTCAAGAQEAAKPRVFGEALDVRVVNVEVVVTDRKGNRVTGLAPGDFRLEVDGKPVSVDYFTEVRDGLAAAPAVPETGGKDAPPATFEPGEPVGTNYLVFIDDFFPLAIRRNEVLDTLRKDLPLLGPGDRMSIVAWDGVRLKRLATWTASREELAGALEAARRRPARGISQKVKMASLRRSQKEQQREQEAIDAVDDVPRRILNPGSTLEELAYAQTVAAEIGDVVNATVGAMRGSDPPAGRKVLLLLAGGWPLSLQGYVRGGTVTLSEDLPETRSLLEELVNTANLLGYTVYPIDVPGLTSVTHTADQSGREVIVSGPGSMVSAETPTAQPFAPSDFGSFEEQEIEGTLEYIGRETGGKPLLNGNRAQALTSPAGDTRSYYWLGFSPGWARDDRSHEVRVKVLRDGLQARARKGFLDLSREAEVGMKVESAILFGETGETGPLAVHAGAPRATKQKGLAAIPLTLEIPADAVTLLRDGDGYAAKAILRLAATDDRGNRSEIPRIEIRLTSGKAPAAGQTLRYETQALLRGKASRIVAIVYDPLTGRIASGETRLDRTAP